MNKTRLISWNVNGIRAAMKKDFGQSLLSMDPDVLCLQETKAQDDQVAEALAGIDGFLLYSNSAERKGYSGTAILTKQEPLDISNGIGEEEHDREGRVITAEFPGYSLVTVYVPNSGQELARLDYRQRWDGAFLSYLEALEKQKPVIVCGDFNVAHQPMDLARPKANYNKTAGYTQQEIDGMTTYLNSKLVDTFRELHPEEIAYSWWSYRFNARAKNIGWRIDYFLASRSIIDRVNSAFILPQYSGSDHCPVGIELEV